MLVLEEGREFDLEANYKEWADHTPATGAVLEIYLPDTDYEPAPEVSVGFLVTASAVGPDGSASVEVRYLGGGDKDLGKEFSSIFNRRKGWIHLCSGKPCFSDEEFGLHTTRYKIFTLQGYQRDFMTGSVLRQVSKWTGSSAGPADALKAKPKAKKRVPDVGADPVKGGKGGELASLRDKLNSLKKRLAGKESGDAKDASHLDVAGLVEEVPSSSEDIPSPTPPGESTLGTGTMLASAPWELVHPLDKEEKRVKRTRSKTLQKGGGVHVKSKGKRTTPKAIKDGSTGDCQAQLALKAAAVAGETPGGSRGRRHSRSSRVGRELMKILTKGSRKERKEKKSRREKKKRIEKKGRASGSRVKPDPDGSSSPGRTPSSGSYSNSSWEDERSSSEEKDLDPPLRKRSKQSPGSVLKLLLAHARAQLDQSAKVALDPLEAQRITEGVKMGSYFSICIRPGNSMGPIRELHHLSTAIDLLRQGNLNLLGDMLASRFMAIHQASVDGNWVAAKHMELFPLEDNAAATSAVLLETRRHAKLAAKAAGFDVSGWSKGGRGKGSWKGKNPGGQDDDPPWGGKGPGKKGKGKKKGRQQNWWADQDAAAKWKEGKDSNAEKKA